MAPVDPRLGFKAVSQWITVLEKLNLICSKLRVEILGPMITPSPLYHRLETVQTQASIQTFLLTNSLHSCEKREPSW